jgi:hypothetical protein
MAAPSVDDLGRSFERYLRAGDMSPRTIEAYLEAVAGFTGYLDVQAGPACFWHGNGLFRAHRR